MHPALFNVRSNLAQLPRSISPHISSSSSSPVSSSIRSLSPSRSSSPHLRSRSASPSPRRFASVLAYHATPPPGGYGKQRTISADQQHLQGQGQESERGSTEHSGDDMAKESQERQESPSRIAVRNLEESWKRFEMDPAPSSPSLVSSSTTFVGSSPLSPLSSRPSSPSPLSRPPYRELIECTFFKDTKISVPAAENEQGPGEGVTAAGEGGRGGGAAAAARSGKSAVLKSESSSKTNNTTHDNDHRIDDGRRRTTSTAATTATPSVTTATTIPAAASSTLLSSSSSTPISSTPANKGAAEATDAPLEDSIQMQQQQHYQGQVQNAFLASNEARHILDLPSLLGQEPDRISQVLAMPIPLQPKPHSSRPSSLASTGNGESSLPTTQDNNTEEANDNASGSALISKLNAKAETTAEAMTKRYAAKNLNMTETDAHRMVQVMAAEIVALHEERAAMVKKMEQAKQEMLEAAQLLRMKAAEAEVPEELQDMSREGRRRRSLGSGSGVRLSVHDDDETSRTRKETGSSEEDRQRNMYDRDEWRERE
ncbi:hypothetical protein KI688_008834 [Linnemannia hyalina]|uniref:Uncharacterized protein n=1 Tax=Linnemannia hyalina TaxID=64524 RepID=A0A9P8BMJ3_9FUNG|nr:hypothetical protein KI688_008834 [Linnemannia hyalina]